LTQTPNFGEPIALHGANGCFLVVLSVAVCLKNLKVGIEGTGLFRAGLAALDFSTTATGSRTVISLQEELWNK